MPYSGIGDFFKNVSESKGFGITGNLLGNVGDGLGVASAFAEDDKTSDGLGLGSGIAGTASAGMGLWDAISGLTSGDADRKKGKGWDLFDNLAGLGGGVSDIISSSAGLAGDSKTKNRAQIASGCFGLLGGGANIIHGIMQLKKGGEKQDGIMNLINGAQKMFGGVTNIGQGANPNSEGWKTAGKVSAVSGAGVGLINTILGIKEAATS